MPNDGATTADPAIQEEALPRFLGDIDLYLLGEGTHTRLYEKLGAHLTTMAGKEGVAFAVWAPNAESISVVGDFNGWNAESHPLEHQGNSGVWAGFVPGLKAGTVYKYRIKSRHRGYTVDKADPYGFFHEVPPNTASVVANLDYTWGDGAWMKKRGERNKLDAPMSIYEVHLGSWRRKPEEGNRPLTYREIAPLLVEHVKRQGFTHVEFLPLMEHPFYGSWGYQVTGFFSPSSRFGSPQDLMYLIDTLHQHDIGVILDWVPAHFPSDEHGLGYFDGTHLYEHADPRQGFHPDWNSLIFNYGRPEVQAFLTSSALFWLDRYHVDGLRVDGVASMLYLDYSREGGEWIPNRYGGRENIEAIDFLRHMNSTCYQEFPDIQTIAEESTAWPMVSRPTYLGGLGFGMKWDMGWMHDTLQYMQRDPMYRKWHQGELTFRTVYAFQENFVLALSHDEVVHGKGPLVDKMPGDDWQKHANLRLLFGYMFAQPGKKLLFQGMELGQTREWNHESSVEWHLLDDPHGLPRGLAQLITELNQLYRDEPALHELDVEHTGFEWVEANDAENSTLAFARYARPGEDGKAEKIIVVCNFTPIPRHNYRLGVDVEGVWREILNTDATPYGGSGMGNFGAVEASVVPWHDRPFSLNLTLPPLSVLFLKGPAD